MTNCLAQSSDEVVTERRHFWRREVRVTQSAYHVAAYHSIVMILMYLDKLYMHDLWAEMGLPLLPPVVHVLLFVITFLFEISVYRGASLMPQWFSLCYGIVRRICTTHFQSFQSLEHGLSLCSQSFLGRLGIPDLV